MYLWGRGIRDLFGSLIEDKKIRYRNVLYLDLGSGYTGIYIHKFYWVTCLRIVYFMYSIPP